MLLGTRVVAAAANAGLLAVALASLPSLVPAGTVLGQEFGWRATFWAIAVITAGCALFPFAAGESAGGTVWREWRAVRWPRLLLRGALATTAFNLGAVLGPAPKGPSLRRRRRRHQTLRNFVIDSRGSPDFTSASPTSTTSAPCRR